MPRRASSSARGSRTSRRAEPSPCPAWKPRLDPNGDGRAARAPKDDGAALLSRPDAEDLPECLPRFRRVVRGQRVYGVTISQREGLVATDGAGSASQGFTDQKGASFADTQYP